jgi:anti-repressor protein
MNELITIERNENGELLVSGRELHEFLESKERFSKWWERMLSYGFEVGIDYTPYQKVHPSNYQEITDYAMKVDMAKEIAMIQRNDKGKQARVYFLDCEKNLKMLNTPSYMIEDPITRAERWIQEQKERKQIETQKLMLEQQVKEYEPKVTYYDKILQSKGTLTITQIAKDYGMTSQALNKILHAEGIQYKQSGQWLLYSKHQNKGFTKSNTYIDSTGESRIHTKWTQKGRLFTHNLLEEKGVKATMDKES